MEMRIQYSLPDDNEEQLFNIKGKEKKIKTTSTKKDKLEAPKIRAPSRTSSESSVDTLYMEQEKQHETHEVLASCSDAEHPDFAHCRHQLKQTVQCADNLDGDHLVVIEETQRNSIEAVHMEHDDNASSSSQLDNIIGVENTVSDLQSENTAEHVEKMNSPVLSDSTFTSKQKKKKKHKLKEQKEAESGADNVHSVEMDQFSESQTAEMAPKRTKKKRKDKKRKKTTHVEDNSDTDFLSNESSKAPETEQPEHIQTSEEITGLKSVRKKKKKKNGSEESQYESVDFAQDINLVPQFNNVTYRSTTQEAVKERPSDVVEQTEAELNDAEHSDSVQCAENLHEDYLSVIEDRHRNSLEVVTEPAVEHEDDLTSEKNLLNKSNSLLSPQGGDISIQNDVQQIDSDFGSEDLFTPLNSQKYKNNEIHKAASITANMEESDQDSDVTQIESEGQFVSIFGPGTPRWCDGDHHAHLDNDSDETQIETKGKSVSVFGPGTPNKQFTTQDRNRTKHPESQETDQSPVGLNAELLSRKEEKCNKKKRKAVSRSHKDSEVTDVEKTMNVQPSKHLPLADEPLKEVYSISSERLSLSKRRTMKEMETDTQETPLFKNGGLSFIKRKRKRKEKCGATNFMQCNTNVDVSSESPVDNITGVKTTPRENEKLHKVENRVLNEEQRHASVLLLEETSEILEESVLSSVADKSVITKVKRKKKKKYQLNEHEDVEPTVENQSVETVQFSESQTAELTSKITKKKRRKDKDRTKMAYVEENSATDIPLNETLDSDRPAEFRVNDQSSEVPETNQPEHLQTSEEIIGCPTTNVTTLKSVKKKKKKKLNETEEPEYESVDLDVSSMSQFDHVDGAVKQQVIEERSSDDNTAEHLEGNTLILKAAKCKKKSQNASSSIDDIIGLEKQVSGLQSESAEELLQKKTKKKQKSKERKNAELASDIGDDVQVSRYPEHRESPTTDLLSRKNKKKRANKDRERTADSLSNEILDHMDDGSSEMRGNNVIRSIEATKTNQFEHLQTSEEITRCPSPSVTKLRPENKNKKKRDRSEKQQYESIDVNLDASQLNVVSGLMAQKMIERRPGDGSAVEHLEGNKALMLKVAKSKRKIQNASSPSQVDDIIGLENTVSDSQSENTTEHVEKMNSPVLSDSTFTSKQKKKNKHKLKEQKEAESGADNVHSVEMEQFSELQTTEMLPKRTKKKRKDKKRTKTTHVEDNSDTDFLSNESSKAPETEQPEHIQTSEEITGLKSVRKKKKKKNGSEESQYESVDFAQDINSVSQFNNVTYISTTPEAVEERPSDVVEQTEAESNDTKHKKKRKRSSLSVNNSSEFSASDAQMQETVAAERKRKKKRNSDHITNVGDELTLEKSDHTVLFEKSQSPMLKSLEAITKKSKRKKNKEMNESINHIPYDSAELETVQITRTDLIIQYNNADRQANIISLGDYADIRKKKKKRKKDTENFTEISMSPNTDSAAIDTPKRAEKQRQRCHDRAGSVQAECNANNFLYSHRKHEENHLKEGSGARESSVSQIDDVILHKSKKKRKRREESFSVLDS